MSAVSVRRAGWSILVAVAAGVIAGVVVGGIGGRVVMLVLRLTSPDDLHGMATDDGFEIGSVTGDTLNLLGATAVLGAVNGALYAVLRRGIPARLRLPLWSLFGAALGGASIVNDDGVDFTLLEPLFLAIVAFVVLPGVASAVVVVLVERWERLQPFGSRRKTLALAIAAALGNLGLLAAAPMFGVLLAIDSLRVRRVLARASTVAVTGSLAVLSLVATVELIRTSARIL